MSRWFGKNRGTTWVLGGLLAVFLVIWSIHGKQAGRDGPAAMPGAPSTFQVVGFYENKVAGDGMPSSRISFSAHAKQVTQVSPLWFSVSPNGSVRNTGYDATLVAEAHARHVLVVPLFISAQGSTNVLWSISTRRLAAKNIAQVVRVDHLDGASIDFELLNPKSRRDLSRFVGDLANHLHPMHKILAVSVFPLAGLPVSINGAYDYKALASVANYLVIMAYDHHYSGGPPGPVSPYPWVKSSVEAAVKQAPANRLVLAIGMYGYDWINNGKAGAAPTLADVTAEALAKSQGAPIHYVPSQSQSEFTYSQNGVSHIVWFMGDQSARARLALAQQYHLAGIALWRLGMEDPNFWKVVP